MRKKAIILDLDNTIYPVSAISGKLFKPLFELIRSCGEYSGDIEVIKTEIMKRPFQYVAKEFLFSENLFSQSLKLLQNLTYDEPIEPFNDYKFIRNLKLEKHLVTVGFTMMQQSKVKQLGIENDFKSIHIIDPQNTSLKKKDVFNRIISENGYETAEVIVVGDDPDSEIRAAQELGIEAVLYNRNSKFQILKSNRVITNFTELSV